MPRRERERRGGNQQEAHHGRVQKPVGQARFSGLGCYTHWRVNAVPFPEFQIHIESLNYARHARFGVPRMIDLQLGPLAIAGGPFCWGTAPP